MVIRKANLYTGETTSTVNNITVRHTTDIITIDEPMAVRHHDESGDEYPQIVYAEDISDDQRGCKHIRTSRPIQMSDDGHHFSRSHGQRLLSHEFCEYKGFPLSYCWGGYGVIVRDDEVAIPAYRMSGTKWYIVSLADIPSLQKEEEGFLLKREALSREWRIVEREVIKECEITKENAGILRLNEKDTAYLYHYDSDESTTEEKMRMSIWEKEETLFFPKLEGLGTYQIMKIVRENGIGKTKTTYSAFPIEIKSLFPKPYKELRAEVSECLRYLARNNEAMYVSHFSYTKEFEELVHAFSGEGVFTPELKAVAVEVFEKIALVREWGFLISGDTQPIHDYEVVGDGWESLTKPSTSSEWSVLLSNIEVLAKASNLNLTSTTVEVPYVWGIKRMVVTSVKQTVWM